MHPPSKASKIIYVARQHSNNNEKLTRNNL